jgi:hypothetical protein
MANPLNNPNLPGYDAGLPQYMNQDIFWYTTLFTNLAVAGTQGSVQTQNIQIDAQSDFWCQKQMFTCFLSTNASTTDSSRIVPAVTVQLVAASQNNLQLIPTFVPQMFGEGELPFIYTAARRFPANSNIQITCTNLDPAQAFNLQLTFFGLKKFLGNATAQ